jgi:hypothetical protein
VKQNIRLPVVLPKAVNEPRFGTPSPIGMNWRVSIVALSFNRKALGPVLGGRESKSDSEIKLNPLPT